MFYNTSEHPLVDAINFNSYRVRAAAQTMSLHMGPSRAHATVVALSSSSGGNSTAGQQPGQQPWQSVRQQVGALSYAPRLRMQLQRCAPGLLRVSAPCTSRVPSRFAQQSALVPPACDTLHFFNPFATPTPLLRPTHFDPPHTHTRCRRRTARKQSASSTSPSCAPHPASRQQRPAGRAPHLP